MRMCALWLVARIDWSSSKLAARAKTGQRMCVKHKLAAASAIKKKPNPLIRTHKRFWMNTKCLTMHVILYLVESLTGDGIGRLARWRASSISREFMNCLNYNYFLWFATLVPSFCERRIYGRCSGTSSVNHCVRKRQELQRLCSR